MADLGAIESELSGLTWSDSAKQYKSKIYAEKF